MKNKIITISVCLLTGIVLGFLFSYMLSDKDNIKNEHKLNFENECNQNKLIEIIIKTGDTIKYEQLRSEFYNKFPLEFLGISIVMANKYNYTQAYYDVFDCIHLAFKSKNQNVDKFNFSNYDYKTKKIALEYLNEAVKRNHGDAVLIKCQYDPNCNNYKHLVDSIYSRL